MAFFPPPSARRSRARACRCCCARGPTAACPPAAPPTQSSSPLAAPTRAHRRSSRTCAASFGVCLARGWRSRSWRGTGRARGTLSTTTPPPQGRSWSRRGTLLAQACDWRRSSSTSQASRAEVKRTSRGWGCACGRGGDALSCFSPRARTGCPAPTRSTPRSPCRPGRARSGSAPCGCGRGRTTSAPPMALRPARPAPWARSGRRCWRG
mmetsp:Transcript_32994/g.110135  ORF Transcript_32994/g.110135 Transcript_32994/m.110135 type:complete len:209 (+) Transcript_32994:433-1059(+)